MSVSHRKPSTDAVSLSCAPVSSCLSRPLVRETPRDRNSYSGHRPFDTRDDYTRCPSFAPASTQHIRGCQALVRLFLNRHRGP